MSRSGIGHGTRLGDHAVVLGGSIAGLFAARVLSDHFERVTLFDRDVLPADASGRKGVPQGAHFHSFALRGERIAEGWFPGLSEGLRRRGAVGVELGPDFRWFHFGGWKSGRPSGLELTCLTRPEIEAEVRVRVAALPNVRIVERTEVLGLVAEGRRVAGVRVRERTDGAEEAVSAALVVDATGRGSQGPRWLEAIGCARPPESSVKVDVGYATRFFRRPPDGTVPWKVLFVVGEAPGSRRLGIVAPVEGGRWIALLVGLLGDHPPADDEGWMAFARSLPNPELADALAAAEPLTSAATYRFPAHLRRHYERMPDLPDGFVVVGDAHCSFNPIYGQGMTAAALGVEALDRALSSAAASGRGLLGFSAPTQRAIASTADGAWMMATGEDLRHPEVAGERPFGTALVNAYMARLMRATQRDPALTAVLYRVVHMLAEPTALMHPAVAARVLWHGW
ncbi:MAG: FAD-dependent oxidoreductase [Myxococcota bacterium]